jgi:hypothetical protein
MRRWMAFALFVATPLLVSGDAAADPPANELQLAAGYAAKETCSCVFVEGQTDAYCTNYGTVPTGVSVTVAIDHAANNVTATYVGTSRTATFTAGQGCVLAGL